VCEKKILHGWGMALVLWQADADATLSGHLLDINRVADIAALLMFQMFWHTA
jgi:hypothetical protein